ncbi:MarR family winged helix-turn-helix transcriptional regulator [Aestuariispira insulae]|uniref:DNA-binding MarR family transcriptional regulator n=1 Tax=Aestuariispira insulae TaxID=1461337 RepID=A0A3D9H8D8_9PROT|nr:MarR family transcriptional regulator [Aestuariispira insulae]RED45764.1 DNA-binding MarR family transcriptional regulator [Aestuariispira insulae]
MNEEMPEFDLHAFFPYQVRVFYRTVSQSVTEVYARRHGLSVQEWRVMAVMGNDQPMAAGDLVEKSSMDKVQISRALKRLEETGLLHRREDPADRRRVILTLTDQGNAIFRELVPLVLKLEQDLLAGLDAKERASLLGLMEKVKANAERAMSAEKQEP